MNLHILSNYLLFLRLAVSTKSALICLSCDEVFQPRHCKTIERCALNEVCILEKYQYDGSSHSYKIGCGVKQMCGQSKRSMLMNSSYVESDFSRYTDHNVDCMKCCSNNMCNSVGCGAPDFPAQRGPVCLSCNLTPDPSICHSVSVCETNEVCFIDKVMEFGDHFFSAGCRRTSACSPSEVSHGFGKRDLHSSRTTHSCCSTDLCNDISNMSMATTIHSTTVTTRSASFQTASSSKLDLVQTTTDIPIGSKFEFWLMFLHLKYELSIGGSDIEHYRHIYISVASEEKGWMLIQSSALPKTLNKTLSQGMTIIDLPKVLKSSNITTIENKGIHLISSIPVSVFGYNEEFTNKEGFYVLPAHSLSTEYMALSYTPARGSLIGIVSTKDNTVVNLHLRITGSLSYKAKVYTNSDILTVTLNKGMTFVVSHKSDMTGTFIKSTKPISVISGNQCAFLGYSGYNGDCSPLREQLIPIEKWGKEFIVPSLNFEKPESILRIVANESNTKVSVVSNLTSISRFIFHGDFIDIVMKTDGPLYVKSSRPILTAIFGYNAFGKGHGNSKEGFLTLVPSLTHYKEKHMIVVPYTYIEDAYLSFDIACGETWSNRTGNQRFISITTDSFVKNDILYNGSPLSHVKYITTRTVVVKNMIYSSITIPSQVGYQTLQSVSGKQMFGVIVYGACWSNLFGYGFPGGFNL